MKKLLALTLGTLMLVGVLAGCGGNTETATTAAGQTTTAGDTQGSQTTQAAAAGKDTFIFVSSVESEHFDPLLGSSGSDKSVFHQVFDTLLRIDDEGGLAPRLATEWEETDGGRSITMKLRDDVTFHDGTPFNAEAVRFTFETYMLDELNAWRANYVSECVVVDEFTVKLVKGSSYAKIYYYLAEYPWIVSPTAYAADPEAFAKNPVGTGAYKFESQGADRYVNLVANEDYWGGAPYFKKVVIRTPLDGSTAVVALQNGEIDMVMVLPNNQIPLVESDPNLAVSVASGWSARTVMMAGDLLGGTENRILRQAIAHAIDREKASLFNDEAGSPVAKNLWSSKLMGSEYMGLADAIQYDPEKAAELLAQSGYNGETLVINTSPDHINICTSIQADLQTLGMTVELVQLDMNTFYCRAL